MIRMFLLGIGFFLMVYGLSVIIIYLNLLTIGYNFREYVNFIIRSFPGYFFIIGLIIVSLTLRKRKRDNL